MAFPDEPLDVLTELRIGQTWTAIPQDVYTRSPISIECGRSEESSRTNPGKLTMELDNRSGHYSARNPRSPYYGRLGRNTPVRVSVPGTESYAELDGSDTGVVSTPDHASLDITGDLDVRVEAALAWHSTVDNVALIGKWGPAGRSWVLRLSQRRLGLVWTEDGTSASSWFSEWTLPPMPRRAAVRVTLDVNNGASGNTTRFFWAPTLAGPWTEIGEPIVLSGTTSVFSGGAPLTIAPPEPDSLPPRHPFVGNVYRAEVRNGINGPLVAAPDFRALAPGTASVTDSVGRPWTLAGTARVSNRAHRFYGEAASWSPRWDASGADVWTPVEAAGTLRRLGQGAKPIDSALRRRLPSRSPLAYWPCEDGANASRMYSPIPGVAPLTVSGWSPAQDDTLAGSAPLPTIAPGGTMRGTVPSSTSTTWAICMPYRVDGAAPATEQEMLSWTTSGTVRRWRITMGTSGAHILGYDANGALIVDSSIVAVSGYFEGWWRLEFSAQQVGGNVSYELRWTKVGGSRAFISGSIAGTVGRVTQIDTSFGPGLPDLSVGHIAIFPARSIGLAYDSADHGYTAEPAIERMSRLAAEESRTVQLAVVDGDPTVRTEPLGSQRPAELLTLLQDAADADGGILHESRADASLVYRTRTSLYNQTPRLVLDYAAEGEIGPPLEPIEDDQRTRNDITVTRTGGSSSRAVRETGPLSVQAPPDGVGLYDDSVTLNLATDDQTQQIAGWRLHLGTWDGARYPSVRLMLHAAPHLIPGVLQLEVGDLIRITNLPPWLPPGPVDLIVQGWSEVLDLYTWDMVLNCTSAGPWTVAVTDDAVRGRVDTDGAQLAAAVTETATTLSVSTTAGPRWTLTPTDLPATVVIGGEEMRVTAITGANSPQTLTVTRSVNGITKSHPAGADVRLAQPSITAL